MLILVHNLNYMLNTKAIYSRSVLITFSLRRKRIYIQKEKKKRKGEIDRKIEIDREREREDYRV